MNRQNKHAFLSAAALSLGLLAAVPAAMAQAPAPVAGSAVVGVSVEEVQVVANGWSLKKQVLGKTVYNDDKKAVGKIDDVIVAPDKAVSYAIVGAGGFLGVGKHDVAIPVNQFKLVDGKFTLPGATKDALKALPAFEYAKHK
jgi:sporulation protein YlmC with PRC-barrel domain